MDGGGGGGWGGGGGGRLEGQRSSIGSGHTRRQSRGRRALSKQFARACTRLHVRICPTRSSVAGKRGAVRRGVGGRRADGLAS